VRGTLAVVLLFSALGLALALAPRVAWVPSLAALGASFAGAALVPVHWADPEGAFLTCWLIVAATAATVQLWRRINGYIAFALSVSAGVSASAVAHLSGSHLQILAALPCLFLCVPGSWLAARGALLPMKIVSSWIIAVAVLAATLQFLPVTAGYLPDHLE
jgi:hypothetical protein